MKRGRAGVVVAVLCALLLASASGAATAGAETGDSAPIRPISDGGFVFAAITGLASPDEYPFQLSPPGPEMRMRQVSDQEIVVEYVQGRSVGYSFRAEPAHDAEGANVPTTLALGEDEEGPVITLIVHFRAGNPAAGGSPFVFPITAGTGWEGGFQTTVVEMNNPTPPPAEAPPAPACVVPSLRGRDLHAAESRLRAHHCALGRLRLAPGATLARGKVTKQFKPAGSRLAGGARVAVKLGLRRRP